MGPKPETERQARAGACQFPPFLFCVFDMLFKSRLRDGGNLLPACGLVTGNAQVIKARGS